MMYSIYLLKYNEYPFYVGLSKDLNRRVVEHKSVFKIDFDCVQLYLCSNIDEARVQERKWIKYYAYRGYKLKNKEQYKPIVKILDGKILEWYLDENDWREKYGATRGKINQLIFSNSLNNDGSVWMWEDCYRVQHNSMLNTIMG